MVQERIKDTAKCAGIVARVIIYAAKAHPDSFTAAALHGLRRNETLFAAWDALEHLKYFSTASKHEFNITGRR